MDKLDRLGWAAGFAFVSHGVRVGIRTKTPEVLDGIEKYLPLGWKPCADGGLDGCALKTAGASARIF